MRASIFVVPALCLAAPLVAPLSAGAQSPPSPDPRVICDYLVSERFYRNYGECISGYRTYEGDECRFFSPEQLRERGYRNLGECVAIRKRDKGTEPS